MEQIKNDLTKVKKDKSDLKKKSLVDKIILHPDGTVKINNWLKQISDSTKGFLDLTKSDLINYLIRTAKDELTAKEIKNIRLAHYSLVKHLIWITPQLDNAIKENNLELTKSLQQELRGLELSLIKTDESNATGFKKSDLLAAKKQRTRKSKNNPSEDKSDNDGLNI